MKKDCEKKNKLVHIEIREMEIDDLAAVFHLGEMLFTSKDFPTLYRTWDEYEVTGLFQEEPDFCLVAEADKRIVGFTMGTTITKAHSPWKYGHLIWLGVHTDYQSSGLATKLFTHFRNKMEESGVRMLLVDTDADNEPALRFFRQMGFAHPERHVYLTLNLEKTNRKNSGRL